jgi:hypothetical protein
MFTHPDLTILFRMLSNTTDSAVESKRLVCSKRWQGGWCVVVPVLLRVLPSVIIKQLQTHLIRSLLQPLYLLVPQRPLVR